MPAPVPLAPASRADAPPALLRRPTVRGKFIFVGDRKLYVKGVAYGPFSSGDGAGAGFEPGTVEQDFARMAASGINSVRVYTVPPRWLLDAAARHELRVMIGVPWEQHVAFLHERSRMRSIEQRVREAVRECSGHPAVLCFAVGNEIPAPIVRWHGRHRVERFIQRLYRAAKEEDEDALVTYVNYPSTEYLRLPFLDLICFNVYLESRDQLEAYMARLQNLADERPLVMAEVGLDSRRNGLEKQASTLAWQVRSIFRAGAAGSFLFSWTDRWHRGGYEIEDWDFGLTTRERAAKPALAAVSAAFAEVPVPAPTDPTRVSVVVCTHNGARTLRDCLEGLRVLEYPDYEVIVVSDGSTDASAEIAREYDARVIESRHGGLAHARNTGLEAAGGDIVAYIDDDACPDPHWLTYLVDGFAGGEYAALGGPNAVPPDAGDVEQAVSNAPGGPTHVLLSDRDAEHIPGCNMAFRKEVLQAVGGFDPQFEAAGDDVDACWRLLDAGFRLGFCPGAVVWHHRRRSVRAYLRQQRGYGKAEALLERKWPEKYSPGGHVTWGGRLYGNGSAQHRGGWRWRIYYGGWGTGLFQSIYGPRSGLFEALPLMPEWYLAIITLAVLSAAGTLWAPLLLALPLLCLAVAAMAFDAALGGGRAAFQGAPAGSRLLRLRALTAGLYVVQPLARLRGRMTHGLTPWRRRGRRGFALPRRRVVTVWSEQWDPTEQRLRRLRDALRQQGAVVLSGGDWDRWDLEVRGGSLGVARVLTAIEEHGGGRQLIRVGWWPRVQRAGILLGALTGALAAGAALAQDWSAAGTFAGLTVLLALRVAYECGAAGAMIRRVVTRHAGHPSQ